MEKCLKDDLEKVLGAMTRRFSEQGRARIVAVLALSKAKIEQSDYEETVNGPLYGYTIYLEVPETLYDQLGDNVEIVEELLKDTANQVTRPYYDEWVEAFSIVSELTAEDDWRDKAKAFLNGRNITNQGRARSDNVAPLMTDGLLFRSPQEVNLYRAFKSLGITFAPLPVFIRGGETYRRIEPDFVLFKDGILMIVEVDGDTIHRETPLEAHYRTTLLVYEGAHVERVNAKDCETILKARECAHRILGRDAIRLPAFHHRHSVVANCQAVRSMGTRGS